MAKTSKNGATTVDRESLNGASPDAHDYSGYGADPAEYDATPETAAEKTARETAEKHAAEIASFFRRGQKPQTTFACYVGGRMAKCGAAGAPKSFSAEALAEFVERAPAVNVSVPAGGQYADPESQKAKSEATRKDVIPGADAVPFLASKMLPVM